MIAPSRRYALVTDGTWRSSVAHLLWEQGVASSNLAVPTTCALPTYGRYLREFAAKGMRFVRVGHSAPGLGGFKGGTTRMNLLSRRSVAVAAGVLLCAGLAFATPARAATVRWVDDDSRHGAGSCDGGAAGSAYSTIQDAVAAADPGDTVKVCPGHYFGPVSVNKTLTINGPKVGVNGATRTFGGASEAVVSSVGTAEDAFILLADNIKLDGFTIQNSRVGVWTNSGNSGYVVRNNIIRTNVEGLFLNSSGTNPTTVTRNKIVANNNGINDPNPASSPGYGIYSDAGLNNVLISANTFSTNFLGGALIQNCTGGINNGITFKSNRFTDNYSDITIYQNNTNVTIQSNKTFDSRPDNDLQWGSAFYIGAGATNVLIGGAGAGNTLNKAPYSGIAVRDDPQCAVSGLLPAGGVTIANNIVNDSGNNGIDVTTADPSRVAVSNNTLNRNGVVRNDLGFAGGDGIFFGAATNGNTISGNNVSGSGRFECEDQSTGAGTAGTANTWTGNNGVGPSSPPAICP
ncbi:MAG: hypothetical protein QOK28_3592 [Actinomycetota bacterium]